MCNFSFDLNLITLVSRSHAEWKKLYISSLREISLTVMQDKQKYCLCVHHNGCGKWWCCINQVHCLTSDFLTGKKGGSSVCSQWTTHCPTSSFSKLRDPPCPCLSAVCVWEREKETCPVGDPAGVQPARSVWWTVFKINRSYNYLKVGFVNLKLAVLTLLTQAASHSLALPPNVSLIPRLITR